MTHFTVLPFLVAMFIAVAGMPTLVVDVHADGLGVEHEQPWCTRSDGGGLRRLGRSLLARLRTWCTACRAPALRAAPGVALLLIVALAMPAAGQGVLLAIPAVMVGSSALKHLRQQAADLDGKLAANEQTILEVDAELTQLRDKVALEKRAMADDERAKLTALTERKKTLRELRASLLEDKQTVAVDLRAAEAENERERTQPDPQDPTADAAASAAAAAQAGVRTPRIEVVNMTTRPGYFGAQLLAVRRAALALKEGRSMSAGDQDLLRSMQAAPTGLNTDVPSDGGFLVAPERSNVILQRAYTQGEILSRVARMPIGAGSNGMTVNAIDETSRADSSRFGGIVSTWVGQGGSVTAGKPKFRQIEMKLRKVMATVYATDEQLVDGVALEGWINRFLPLELSFRCEDAVINGSGSNQPLGVMNSGAVITITRSQSSRILAEDLRAMVNRMWAPLWGSAAFFVDQSTLGEFDLLAVPIGTGGQLDPSYKPAGSVPGQKYATYKNIPIIPVEYCAALGTSGDIVLVNLSEYILIDKGAVEQAVSIHVAFLTDEQVFRFIYRVDGQLQWNSALTPKSGGNTLSCALILS